MDFWQQLSKNTDKLWKDTKRFFSKSCPKCGKNNADLPSSKKIIRVVISAHPHDHRHYTWHDGKMETHVSRTFNKTVKFSCQCCGNEWTEFQMSPSPD